MNNTEDENLRLVGDGKGEQIRRLCPACGTRVRRVEARFCATCGRTLDESGYLPADSIRASYHLPRRPQRRHARAANSFSMSDITLRPQSKSAGRTLLPAQNQNTASAIALAFATYALVPYLGILFCPGAIVAGSIGLFSSYRAPRQAGFRVSLFSVFAGLIVFGAQIFLWWILYKIPEWAGAR